MSRLGKPVRTEEDVERLQRGGRRPQSGETKANTRSPCGSAAGLGKTSDNQIILQINTDREKKCYWCDYSQPDVFVLQSCNTLLLQDNGRLSSEETLESSESGRGSSLRVSSAVNHAVLSYEKINKKYLALNAQKFIWSQRIWWQLRAGTLEI